MKFAVMHPMIRIAALLVCFGVAAGGPGDALSPNEAVWKVSEILKALCVRDGDTVADIGAGDGFLTLRLASHVGHSGKVLAVDIDEGALERLKRRLAGAAVKNVELIKGAADDPMLAPLSLDGAVILRAYHEFRRYREMLAKIGAALRPRARLVIADAGAEDGASREAQVARHVMAQAVVENDLAEAGFKVVVSLPSFARLRDGGTGWLIAAERHR